MNTDAKQEDAYQRSLPPRRSLEYRHAVREGMHRHPQCRCTGCRHFIWDGERPLEKETPVCALGEENATPPRSISTTPNALFLTLFNGNVAFPS